MRTYIWAAVLCFTTSLSVSADPLEIATTLFLSVVVEPDFPTESNASSEGNTYFAAQGSCNTNLFYTEIVSSNTTTQQANICELTNPLAVDNSADPAAEPVTIIIAPY